MNHIDARLSYKYCYYFGNIAVFFYHQSEERKQLHTVESGNFDLP